MYQTRSSFSELLDLAKKNSFQVGVGYPSPEGKSLIYVRRGTCSYVELQVTASELDKVSRIIIETMVEKLIWT